MSKINYPRLSNSNNAPRNIRNGLINMITNIFDVNIFMKCRLKCHICSI